MQREIDFKEEIASNIGLTVAGYCLNCRAPSAFVVTSQGPTPKGALLLKGRCQTCNRTMSRMAKARP